MTKNQQVIKYLAISFAIFLIITIFTAIIKTGFSLVEIVDKKITNQDKITNVCIFTNQEITNLEIDIKASNLIIQEGSRFVVESNNQDLKCSQSDKKIKIEDDTNFWLNGDSPDLIITIPKNYNYQEVEIETGAGKLTIDSLKTRILDLELGAGETVINNLEVEKGKIKTGVGAFTIKNGLLNNINFDMGVGKVDIDVKLTGYNKFKTGIGAFNLNLKGLETDYQFEINKGLGKVLIGNQEVNDNTILGDGANIITIDGGIGMIKVKFQENKF